MGHSSDQGMNAFNERVPDTYRSLNVSLLFQNECFSYGYMELVEQASKV